QGSERLGRLDDDLRAPVLQVPHQGSAGSTPPALRAAVQPAEAVITVGPNHYGHPAPETVARLLAAGATLRRTDRDGMLTYRTAGRGWTVRAYGKR
ncbi:MAG: hypothetical protein IT204_12730, partial [Fimbriimonadaceae bacterium]|nr:hypothetical protein [Fimbriimonadaceae bacterium]